jgi:glycosyltransferase involved in cell wall biosynthesis
VTLTISVIIPAYNRAHKVAGAIDSVLSQSLPVNELIIVDDGSTDNLEAVIVSMARVATIPIIFLRQENRGPSAARNLGICNAKSNFVMPLDSDDRLMPDATRNLTRVIQNDSSVDMVFGSRVTVLPANKKKLTKAKALHKDRVKNYEDELLSTRPTVGIGAALIKKSFAMLYPFPEGFRICEDLAFFATAFLKGNCLAIDVPIVEIDQTSHHSFRDAGLLYPEHRMAYEHALSQSPEGSRKSRLRRMLRAYPALRSFRELHRAGENQHATRMYLRAFRIDPIQALHISYVRKFLRGLFGFRHRASQKVSAIV